MQAHLGSKNVDAEQPQATADAPGQQSPQAARAALAGQRHALDSAGLLGLQRMAGNGAVSSVLNAQRFVPAPAGGATPPGPPAPSAVPGNAAAAASENDPVELPVGGNMHITLSATERELLQTKANLTEFDIGVGRLSTPEFPLGETPFLGQIIAGADKGGGLDLPEAKLMLSPIEGVLDAAQVNAAQSTRQAFGKVGAAVGGIFGGLNPLALGPGEGGILGGKAGEALADVFAGDRIIRFTITRGDLHGHLRLTYKPWLTLKISAAGFSWLANAKATLQTSLSLLVKPAIDFAGTSFTLTFRDGRLTRTEFELKPVITPKLGLEFDANGQLSASLNLLPILDGDDRKAQPDEGGGEGIEVAELVTAPFKILHWNSDPVGAVLDLTGSRGSPFQVGHKNVGAEPGKVADAFKDYLVKGNKDMPLSAPPDAGGPVHSGLTEADAIPLVWWKPFSSYLDRIPLPESEFGKRPPAKRFPHLRHTGEQRGVDLALGVDDWPYVGMPLKKKRNARGTGVEDFVHDLQHHGIFLDQTHPNYQIDHVIDLVFEKGHDNAMNLWPLRTDVNARAGGRWSNGQVLVTWCQQPGGPPLRTIPAHVPEGRWFVISDFQTP